MSKFRTLQIQAWLLDIALSVAFGIWQHSITAAIFVFLIPLLVMSCIAACLIEWA